MFALCRTHVNRIVIKTIKRHYVHIWIFGRNFRGSQKMAPARYKRLRLAGLHNSNPPQPNPRLENYKFVLVIGPAGCDSLEKKKLFRGKIGSALHQQYSWSSKIRSQESEYFKWSTITWDSNDPTKVYYPIRLCSSTDLLQPSQITSSTSIALTITRQDSKSFVQSFAFWK